MTDWLIPDWPAPATVKSCITTRTGGVSVAPFDSFNLGDHVDDQPQSVAANRLQLTAQLHIQPAWLRQVHGVTAVEAEPGHIVDADASWTATPGIACTIMTADCLPALFCDRAGTRVAAAHAASGAGDQRDLAIQKTHVCVLLTSRCTSRSVEGATAAVQW